MLITPNPTKNLGRKLIVYMIGLLVLSPWITSLQRTPAVYANTSQSIQDIAAWAQSLPPSPVPNVADRILQGN
ncbi:MAG TPA: hypothetical protein VMB73_18290 [Acetobacteraceae bacterium]|nr:hypothetical protein [Acetobacteraceae bacterium]